MANGNGITSSTIPCAVAGAKIMKPMSSAKPKMIAKATTPSKRRDKKHK